MCFHFCSTRGVRPSCNARRADFLTRRFVLSRTRCLSRHRPFSTPISIPSDLFNRVNGWSYEEWCRMGILNYLGPPKGVPSAVLTQACST
jgi:hypothetical protein